MTSRNSSLKATPNRGGKLVLVAIIIMQAGADCRADVIYLKNGKRVNVARAWEAGNKIHYEKDGNVFGFSKELVEKVVPGLPVPDFSEQEPDSSSRHHKAIPVEILNETLDIGGLLQEKVPSRVIQDGKINEQRLLEIEKESQRNPEDSEKQNLYRNALGESIQWHLKQNHQAAALSVLEHYLLLEPEDLQANLALSWLQIRQGQYQQAENTLSRAKIKNENSSELNYLLGMAYYMQDKNSQASRALRQSLELKYRPQIEQLLKKVDQENWAENEYKQASSLHFVIRYEGNETNQTLGEGILGSLEKSFSELENQLNFSPREAIAVVLYPDEVFRDVTKTPSWVSALNDGKIRFPIKGLSTIDGNVQQILKHELTHSFIRLKSGGNCPLWLNEGLAQYLSGDTSRQFLPMAKQMLAQKRIPLLSSMQGSFMSMAAAQVVWAYQESLLATEFVAKTHGIEDIQRLLHLTGVTGNFERAARTILRKGYPELQQEFEDYIQSQ